MVKGMPPKPSIFDKLISGSGNRDRQPFYIPVLERFGEPELRASLQRDIAWLLNDIHFEAAVSLDDFPEIRTSVLNQGLPELVGRSLEAPAMLRRAAEVTTAIRAFEQRLRPDTVVVRFDSTKVDTQNKLHFSVHGEIRNAMEENWIEFTTTVDLDDGRVEIET